MPAGKRTIVGFGAVAAPPAATERAAASRSEPPALAGTAAIPDRAASPAAGAGLRTMVGMAPAVATAPRASSQASGQETRERAIPYSGKRTMLGVAIPGIAPLKPGEDPVPLLATAAAESAPIAEPAVQPQRSTQALYRGIDGPLPPIVPAPSPLAEAHPPPPPRIVRKRGAPLAAVALVAGGIVVAGGAAIALLSHRSPPISALARVTPEGTDVLHLTCDPASCADGTVAELDGVEATFVGGASDLPLARPLHVGNNPLTLHIDRPRMGRDELLSLAVPVAYRVRADVSPMSAPHPSIVVHVEALAGSEVRVAGNRVSLDRKGVGTYSLDESIATEGAADESRVVAVDVPYTVAADGATNTQPPDTGIVSARVTVAPLRVDAPGARAVVDVDHVLLAGRAAKGAFVTVDGVPAPVGADGTFETTVTLSALGEISAEVRSGSAALAPRTVHIALKRVTNLSDEAKAFEKGATLGYDAALANLATDAGQLIVVDGDVIEPRTSGHRTLLLVDDRRGCAKGPCLARVVVGQEFPIARGDHVRAFGRVTRGFTTPTGQTVPEVEADFAMRARR